MFRAWLFRPILLRLSKLATKDELAQALEDLNVQIKKVQTETNKKIDFLAAEVQEVAGTNPRIDDALAAVRATVNSFDAQIPDEAPEGGQTGG